jgi:hypothetical protein
MLHGANDLFETWFGPQGNLYAIIFHDEFDGKDAVKVCKGEWVQPTCDITQSYPELLQPLLCQMSITCTAWLLPDSATFVSNLLKQM